MFVFCIQNIITRLHYYTTSVLFLLQKSLIYIYIRNKRCMYTYFVFYKPLTIYIGSNKLKFILCLQILHNAEEWLLHSRDVQISLYVCVKRIL